MADLGALAEFFNGAPDTLHNKVADKMIGIMRGTDNIEMMRSAIIYELCGFIDYNYRAAYAEVINRLYGSDYESIRKDLTEVSKLVYGSDVIIKPPERKEFLRIWLRLTASYFRYNNDLIMDACTGKDSF